MASIKVEEILVRINNIHNKKNEDYATEENPFSNFERAAEMASWFNDPIDKVFVTMIGIKLTRLAELRNGKIPKNESIDDSFLDNETYAILWHAYYLTKNMNPHLGDRIRSGPFNESLEQYRTRVTDRKSESPSQKPKEQSKEGE